MQVDRLKHESENSRTFSDTLVSACFGLEPCPSCPCSSSSSSSSPYWEHCTGWKRLSVSTEWLDRALTAGLWLIPSEPCSPDDTRHSSFCPTQVHRSRSAKGNGKRGDFCLVFVEVSEIAMRIMSISAGNNDDHFHLNIKTVFLFYRSF